MTHEETVSTLIEVAGLASTAVTVALGGLGPEEFDPSPDEVEDLLAMALRKLIEETDAIDSDGTRNQLLGALVRFLEG